MKKILYILAIVFTISSCEDKVNVDLDTANPKLVIDANILWQKGTLGNEQKIKLTTTTNYYSNVIPVVSGATVTIANSTNTIFNFIETPNTGEYVCTNFEPILNETYTLSVIVNGITYKSTEKIMATPSIDVAEQTTVQGFGGDVIQIKFYYQDNGLETNFYLIGFKKSTSFSPEYGVIKDEFFQGNQMFGFYSDEDLKAGDSLFMSLQGINQRYYNYMNKLTNIVGSGGGSPFSTPPATLRGNIINQNNENDYPLGYFHLSEIDTRNYLVQ